MITRMALKPRTIAALLLVGLVAGLMLLAALGVAEPADAAPMMGMDHTGMMDHPQGMSDVAPHGFTDGWLNGQTVQFFYTKNFFCQPPPSSGAPSLCEVGADGGTDPRPGIIPTLFVMTPLGFRPDASTLQCPIVGSCINHPSTIDLSRIGGPSNAPLPAHSHIIDERHGGWWEIVVIGVKDLGTWNQIVAGKSLTTVRALQAADPAGTHITGDIRTNAYLFFNVR